MYSTNKPYFKANHFYMIWPEKKFVSVQKIEIWFDGSAGSIHWMLLDELPRGQGGPKSILLELVGQSPVADEFFTFQFHDVLSRRVISE